MITTRPTRLNWSSDLSKRTLVPEGTQLEVVARIYGGKVLQVRFEGSEYYTANPDWTPPEVTESVQQSLPEPTKTLPWDRPQKRGRGRPRKEKTHE
jgi:hypothetical protein